MIKTEETTVIITMLIEDSPIPAPGSRRGYFCDGCAKPVWIGHASLLHMKGDYKIRCNRCIVPDLLSEQPPEIQTADPRFQSLFDEVQEEMVGSMIEEHLKRS